MKMTEVKDKEPGPVCPFCEKDLEEVNCKKIDTSFLSTSIATKNVVFCPHCRKVLGVTHRKGLLAN